MAGTLLDKVWDLHKIGTLPSGQDQMFVGMEIIHESGAPHNFQLFKEMKMPVLFPDRIVTTVDHVIPTDDRTVPFADAEAWAMYKDLEKNAKEFGLQFFGLESEYQGICHVIGPELGMMQPGMFVSVTDSHTPTHGAMGCIAVGGSAQHVLATQSIAIVKPKIRKIEINGTRGKGIYGKDVILKLLAEIGISAGIGFAYEYAGDAIGSFSIDDRMTICNMSWEGGARIAYMNPDELTYEYLKGRKYAPKGEEFERALGFWRGMASSPDADYDDVYKMDITGLEPMVTWGINPGHAIGVNQPIPPAPQDNEMGRIDYEEAYKHMGCQPGQKVLGTKIDVAFIGSCTNSRLTDLREAAKVAKGNHVKPYVKALVVPGSKQTAREAEQEGLDRIFKEAGFEWRLPGCSMCNAMSPDLLSGRQTCASTSNRNFIGRQGSPEGRTILLSPAMAAAAAVCGEIADVREFL
jgi:3-isopropylmalate/(R)-2-methylmalate dehydratase large subunit